MKSKIKTGTALRAAYIAAKVIFAGMESRRGTGREGNEDD